MVLFMVCLSIMGRGKASLIPPQKADPIYEFVEHSTELMVCFDTIRHFDVRFDINICMFKINVI